MADEGFFRFSFFSGGEYHLGDPVDYHDGGEGVGADEMMMDPMEGISLDQQFQQQLEEQMGHLEGMDE